MNAIKPTANGDCVKKLFLITAMLSLNMHFTTGCKTARSQDTVDGRLNDETPTSTATPIPLEPAAAQAPEDKLELPGIFEFETTLQFKEAAGVNRGYCSVAKFRDSILAGTGNNNYGWNAHFIKTGDKLCRDRHPGTERLDQEILATALKMVPSDANKPQGPKHEVCEVKVKFRCFEVPSEISDETK